MAWRRPDYFSRIFDEMTREFEEANQMIERMFRTARNYSGGEVKTFGPWYYGFSVRTGPDGKPVFREFGNVRPTAEGQVIEGYREPLLDVVVDDREDIVRIAAEMPGISKEDVKLKATESVVNLNAESGDRKYRAEIPLSVEIDPDSGEASFNNGILEATFKLKESAKKDGKDIKVK
ncbi:MAG: Hsp20/alpha crystallin family protein [Candidatus Thorarchaeota archaeon]|nr:MAG: Hsp20/alpha crystallin family protein [Candidatus Thorarchaeota archaeon]RLI55752.1 MAG: Hsp20/alpha crystallin family protein [Candidatus Thorarchaeota archaeon]